jgi:signal transduction histidine kinase
LIEYVILNLDDSGPGIHAPNQERAFERFNRFGQSRTDGVGLGLSIVLLVVELYRAKIKLLDSPLGGLRAQVHFPQPDVQYMSAPEPSTSIA